MTATPCPCGSTLPFDDCCAPRLDGRRPAETAEALMRSRYTAYTRADEAYLKTSWHPDHCPDTELLQASFTLQWRGLEVVTAEAGTETDDEGWVEFIATFKANGRVDRLRERSRFCRLDGLWVYVEGETVETTDKGPKVGRNSPCPCGSGRKFKQCCAQRGSQP